MEENLKILKFQVQKDLKNPKNPRDQKNQRKEVLKNLLEIEMMIILIANLKNYNK